jgi:D-lactate dehydrogenase
MTRIAFIGTNQEEQDFFMGRLPDWEISFLPNDQWETLDPATEIISVFIDFEVTADVFAKLPNLKLIACRSTGFNNITMALAREHGVMVANTPGYGATSVAEYVFGLVLMLSRKIAIIQREIKDSLIHEGIDRNAERGWDLNGRTIGIIGLGAIGRGVAKIANGFGMKILAYEPYKRDEDFAKQYSITFIDEVADICRESDIVTLHAPYTPGDHHLLNTKVLSGMKKTALVINTSRGELVNTLQLARMLKNDDLGGAGLDVIEDESFLTAPNAVLELAATGNEKAIDKLKHALAMASLQRMPNVIITNHNAYNTVEALQKINDMTVDNIINFVSNETDKVFVVTD